MYTYIHTDTLTPTDLYKLSVRLAYISCSLSRESRVSQGSSSVPPFLFYFFFLFKIWLSLSVYKYIYFFPVMTSGNIIFKVFFFFLPRSSLSTDAGMRNCTIMINSTNALVFFSVSITKNSSLNWWSYWNFESNCRCSHHFKIKREKNFSPEILVSKY